NCASSTEPNCVASINILSGAVNTRSTGLDPVIAKLFQSYPAPNNYNVGDALYTAGFVWNPPTQHKGPAIMARVDHTFNENNSMFVRYLFSDYNTLGGDPLNARPVVFPGFPPLGEVFRRTTNLAISYRRVISPRLVNEMTVSYARFNFLFTQ